MAKVIAYTNNLGGVSIITPITNIEEVAKKDVPDGKPYIILEDTELPSYEHRSKWVIVGSNVLIDPNVIDPAPLPNPKGFYEKLIGLKGDTHPLHLVYKSITGQALDDSKDTSSLAYAVLIYNNALSINDWSLPESKEAYLSAYGVLKRFLTVGQVSIIDAENINFNLV